jgi:hypothetical protein
MESAGFTAAFAPRAASRVYEAEVAAGSGLRANRMTLSLKSLPRSHRGQLIGVNGILPEFV